MLNKEDLVLIRDLMNEVIDEKLEPIKKDIADMKDDIANMKDDIANMKDDIEIIKEDVEITRVTTNEIGKWVEANATPSNPYPVDKAI